MNTKHTPKEAMDKWIDTEKAKIQTTDMAYWDKIADADTSEAAYDEWCANQKP